MAERGAHLSATYLKKPSIFELLAQEALSNTFHPALKRIAIYLATKNPVRYSWLVQYYEECFLIFNTALQYHYLRTYGSSFSEHFYNLRRVWKNDNHGRLPFKHEFLSLAFIVLVPYIRNKLQQAAESSEDIHHLVNQNLQNDLRRDLILLLHKITHVSLETLSLLFCLGYITGRLQRHSMFLWLAGVTLVYQTEETDHTVCWRSIWNAVRARDTRLIAKLFPLKAMLSSSLELSAFFIQFLNWWHSEQLVTNLSALPVPSAPKLKSRIQTPSGICPICKKKIEISTALSVSGYVFCFKCIRSALMKNRCCPVTNIPATENDLVRLYIETD